MFSWLFRLTSSAASCVRKRLPIAIRTLSSAWQSILSSPVRAPKLTTHVSAGDQPSSTTPSSNVSPLCDTLSPSSV